MFLLRVPLYASHRLWFANYFWSIRGPVRNAIIIRRRITATVFRPQAQPQQRNRKARLLLPKCQGQDNSSRDNEQRDRPRLHFTPPPYCLSVSFGVDMGLDLRFTWDYGGSSRKSVFLERSFVVVVFSRDESLSETRPQRVNAHRLIELYNNYYLWKRLMKSQIDR